MSEVAYIPVDSICAPTPLETALKEWTGFVELLPGEPVLGSRPMYELRDGPDSFWAHEMHWMRPSPEVAGVGCYFLRDVTVWAPGIIALGSQFVGDDSVSDKNDRHNLSPLDKDGFFDEGRPLDRVIDRPVLVVDGVNYGTWGHWIVEYLPRVGIAHDLLGDFFDELAIALPATTPEWVIQLLIETCQVRRDALLLYRPLAERLICRRLIRPSFAYSGIYTFHSFLLDFYARTRPSAVKPYRKICVSRGKAGNRAFPLRERFESLAADHGYEVVQPEKLSVKDQIALFAEAIVVVGEHGSGMHNSVFCAPGTIVGCLGFWNAIQLHLGYVCNHTNVYVTQGCHFPTEQNPDFVLGVTETSLASLFAKIEMLLNQDSQPVLGLVNPESGLA